MTNRFPYEAPGAGIIDLGKEAGLLCASEGEAGTFTEIIWEQDLFNAV